jgi:hypothetical protein
MEIFTKLIALLLMRLLKINFTDINLIENQDTHLNSIDEMLGNLIRQIKNINK